MTRQILRRPNDPTYIHTYIHTHVHTYIHRVQRDQADFEKAMEDENDPIRRDGYAVFPATKDPPIETGAICMCFRMYKVCIHVFSVHACVNACMHVCMYVCMYVCLARWLSNVGDIV